MALRTSFVDGELGLMVALPAVGAVLATVTVCTAASLAAPRPSVA
jgi:hypothetical protein